MQWDRLPPSADPSRPPTASGQHRGRSEVTVVEAAKENRLDVARMTGDVLTSVSVKEGQKETLLVWQAVRWVRNSLAISLVFRIKSTDL